MPDLLQIGRLIGLDEAASIFRTAITAADVPEQQLFLQWCEQILVDHPERSALVLPPGASIEGDLLLDYAEPPFAAGGVGTILALGDLAIAGRLVDTNSEGGPFLLAIGTLRAGDIIKAATAIVVLGSVSTRGLILCDGDNGALITGADLEAQALIDCDHEIYVAGDVRAQVISDDMGNMRALLVPEVFEDPEDQTDEWPDSDLLRDRLLDGLPVLKGAS